MLRVFGHYKYFYFYSAGIDFRRQNLTSTDVRLQVIQMFCPPSEETRAKEIASDYQLKGVTLRQVKNSPYLGVSISENLEWGDHISKIASKANSTLGFLRRNWQGCPSKLKKIAYISMVRSLLEYSCPVWDPYRQGDVDKLNKIRRAAARFVTNNYQRKSSVTALI